jgi:hypothetical protein
MCSAVFGQNTFVVETPRVVGEGEQFKIVFVADGEMESFNGPIFSGAEVLAGPFPSRMTSVQIINGKREDNIQISYSYVIRPTGAENIKIGSAQATIGGKTYTTNEVTVEVVKDGSSAGGQSANSSNNNSATAQSSSNNGSVTNEDLFLRINFSKNKVVKGEPIIATLKIYTRVPISNFEDVKFPVFNGFWSQEIETPQNISFERESVNNKIYEAATIRKYLLLPQKTGDIKIEPAEIVCLVPVRTAGSRGRSVFDDFFDSGYETLKKRIVSNAAGIDVSPLPSGAPASFGGGVGNFNMNVKLSRDNIKAHEAASLIVDISGSGNLNLIETPNVELPADFELYDVKTENNFTNRMNGISGSKRFEFPFIPRSAGEFVIPPIEYSFYDIKTKKYVTLQSDSLFINVGKGDANAVNNAVSHGLTKQAITNLGEDIRYIKTGNAGLSKKGEFFITSFIYYISLLCVVAIFAALFIVIRKRIKLRGDVVRTKNRKANKVAKQRLKLANSYLNQNLYSPFYEELHKALLGYISDKLGIQFADMQRDKILETLEAKGVSKENADSFMGLLDDCEMARYSQAGGNGEMNVQFNKAMEVISNLENKL